MRHALFVVAGLLMFGVAPLAHAQVDLAGQWATRQHEDALERGGGPEIGEYQGLPINDADRFRADSWSASLWTVPEHQCIPHPADYGPNFSSVQIWKDLDPVSNETVAWHTQMAWMTPERTIWMDGRPHPPAYAAHTWQGFSTGEWQGDILTVTTTHLKIGWIRRNGIPRSDKATLVEHWIRHDNYLTLVSVITDPVYLTEPFIRTTNWTMDPDQRIDPYPCESVVEVERPLGAVPHHLPGTNTFLKEFPERHGIPADAARGGAETM